MYSEESVNSLAGRLDYLEKSKADYEKLINDIKHSIGHIKQGTGVKSLCSRLENIEKNSVQTKSNSEYLKSLFSDFSAISSFPFIRFKYLRAKLAFLNVSKSLLLNASKIIF